MQNTLKKLTVLVAIFGLILNIGFADDKKKEKADPVALASQCQEASKAVKAAEEAASKLKDEAEAKESDVEASKDAQTALEETVKTGTAGLTVLRDKATAANNAETKARAELSTAEAELTSVKADLATAELKWKKAFSNEFRLSECITGYDPATIADKRKALLKDLGISVAPEDADVTDDKMKEYLAKAQEELKKAEEDKVKAAETVASKEAAVKAAKTAADLASEDAIKAGKELVAAVEAVNKAQDELNKIKAELPAKEVAALLARDNAKIAEAELLQKKQRAVELCGQRDLEVRQAKQAKELEEQEEELEEQAEARKKDLRAQAEKLDAQKKSLQAEIEKKADAEMAAQLFIQKGEVYNKEAIDNLLKGKITMEEFKNLQGDLEKLKNDIGQRPTLDDVNNVLKGVASAQDQQAANQRIAELETKLAALQQLNGRVSTLEEAAMKVPGQLQELRKDLDLNTAQVLNHEQRIGRTEKGLEANTAHDQKQDIRLQQLEANYAKLISRVESVELRKPDAEELARQMNLAELQRDVASSLASIEKQQAALAKANERAEAAITKAEAAEKEAAKSGAVLKELRSYQDILVRPHGECSYTAWKVVSCN